MGTIINPLVKLSGKIGDFIFSQRNGKTVISQRLHKNTKSKDPRVIARRKRFANASAISSLLTKEPLMKEIWKKPESFKKLMPYNKMLKYYYAYVSDTDIYHPIQLSPNFPEFEVEPKNICFNENTLSVIFNPLNLEYCSEIISEKAKYLQMFALIKYKYTYEMYGKPFMLFSAISNKVQVAESIDFTLYHDFYGSDSQNLVELQSDRLIFIVLALDENLHHPQTQQNQHLPCFLSITTKTKIKKKKKKKKK